jgi:hypothetical protein
MKAKEYLRLKGKRELENFKGFTGEYVITPPEMEEFTKQQAIAFAEWLDSFGWRQFQESTWYNTISHKHKATDYYTTGQLYRQFQKEQE